MPCCSAINCSNRTEKGYRLYRFPRNDKNRAKWVHNMRRGGNWQPSEAARLCEKHFEKTQFENKRADGKVKLRPNAVPTIFNLPNPPLNTECLKRRHYKNMEVAIVPIQENVEEEEITIDQSDFDFPISLSNSDLYSDDDLFEELSVENSLLRNRIECSQNTSINALQIQNRSICEELIKIKDTLPTHFIEDQIKVFVENVKKS
ncbi:THAP domain-containing protein 5-like isoform X1 [Sitophilus oryzae]|uniref:THAP domain-containing protein 5-like isoform X1 n=1 Tax=Sitophilus oryzae TaxID=7048 RepID=A0A6J2YGQ8_SITOR|nr:THAP domain-containing protein 5-like isoform X1 [Sitophilus oryzae]XP_030762464.1 THAP domain-containing protein 5-like isoform X1 [Sitophilus oryzae]XP_030762465.1 THAP domain-containing protein 5-like isoform X1 [Sitophilus oryzae]XP_030762466.1 THAP domain-containing protein 5-like isoform X1 [Sitophilus oryzae]XP_030762467.1 THAP domain-containing protein 5-like isoform X1 [Sitophilus oryzae]